MNQTEKKKKAILAVTFTLLNEKKINDITVDEIAEKAVVSKVTLFKYYGSKNHLMNMVIRQALQKMAQEITVIIDSSLNFDTTYAAITQLKLKQLEEYQPIFSENLLTQYASRPDFFDSDTIAVQTKIYEGLFKKGQTEGKIAAAFTQQDFMLILAIFNEGLKGIAAEVLLKKINIISRFFLHGLQ